MEQQKVKQTERVSDERALFIAKNLPVVDADSLDAAPSPLFDESWGAANGERTHQSQLAPEENKFHMGNGDDGKHYWITPPEVMDPLQMEFQFDFDPCPYPLPEGFDGLTCEWGQFNYVNPPFGSIMHQGRKKGPTAWARKAITENARGKTVVLVYPIDKWVLMLLKAGAEVRNLGDVRWLATEDGAPGKGTGRHIACFILKAAPPITKEENHEDGN